MNLVGPGDEVLMFEPYYTQYVNHIELAGAKIVTAPMVVSPITGEWLFNFNWGLHVLAYIIVAFILPTLYGSWKFVLFHYFKKI